MTGKRRVEAPRPKREGPVHAIATDQNPKQLVKFCRGCDWRHVERIRDDDYGWIRRAGDAASRHLKEHS